MSDLLIKGMEMPTSCEECILDHKFFKWLGCNKHVTGDTIADGERSPACPLIEVPPHGRLGDLTAIEAQLDYIANLDWNKQVGASGGMLAALEVVEDAPTIIPASKKEE